MRRKMHFITYTERICVPHRLNRPLCTARVRYVRWVTTQISTSSSVHLHINVSSHIWKKGRDLTQSYDKSPYTHRKIQKATWQHKNATKIFDYTTITNRLRTVTHSPKYQGVLLLLKTVYQNMHFLFCLVGKKGDKHNGICIGMFKAKTISVCAKYAYA